VTRDLEALRARIQAIAAREILPPPSRGRVGEGVLPVHRGPRLPSGCTWEETPFGPVAVRPGWEHWQDSALPPDAIARCVALAATDLARPLFLDTETTGLSGGTGTVPFLVGLAWPHDGGLQVAQYFLHELDQERALLWAIGERLHRSGVLVTYNGRCFDWPLLQTRLVLARAAASWPTLPHLDLLAMVRRLFRPRLPDCTLRTVEVGVLAVERGEDLPGALIPSRYFAWLRGAPAAIVDAVFAHNRQDVVSLAVLMSRLDRVLDGREELPSSDRLARARYLEACGFPTEAMAGYRRLWDEERGLPKGAAGLRLARLLRRTGRWPEAREILECCWATQTYPYPAAIELAKLLEHQARDLLAARRLVGDAQNLLRMAAVPDARWASDLERRRTRLDRRLGWEREGELALTG
jgi:uncharacterized protein